MDERAPVYQQGTIHVHSDGRPSEEIVEEIIDRLWSWADAQHAWALDHAALDHAPETAGSGESRASD